MSSGVPSPEVTTAVYVLVGVVSVMLLLLSWAILKGGTYCGRWFGR